MAGMATNLARPGLPSGQACREVGVGKNRGEQSAEGVGHNAEAAAPAKEEVGNEADAAEFATEGGGLEKMGLQGQTEAPPKNLVLGQRRSKGICQNLLVFFFHFQYFIVWGGRDGGRERERERGEREKEGGERENASHCPGKAEGTAYLHPCTYP